MAIERACVVIRQLNNSRPVTSKVILLPLDRHDIDDIEHYFEYQAREHIEEFKKDFIEFKDANFWVDIVTVHR